MFTSINKTLVAAAKFLVEAAKNSFVVHNFVAVTKPFFSVCIKLKIIIGKRKKNSLWISGWKRFL